MPLSPRDPVGSTPGSALSHPARLFSLLLMVEIAAVVALVLELVIVRPAVSAPALITALALGLAGVVHTEVSLGIERVRHRIDGGPHIDLSSVWTFAAAVLLPGVLSTVVLVVIYLHLYLRAQRRSGVPLHRVVFSTATVVLATHAAGAVLRAVGENEMFRTVGGLLALLLALLVYAAVNLVLVVAAILLSGASASAVQAIGHRDELLLEFATLAMGAVVAGVVASFGPAYAVFVLPPLLVLHRTVLVRQLEAAASTDGKTGLLNAAAWRLEAGNLLRVARRTDGSVAVLVLDLDHFKRVNDRYGHLAGDEVLSAIAIAMRAEVRDDDLVGRFGGEEFVVLLAGSDGEDLGVGAELAAERIRARVAGLRIEVGTPGGPAVIDRVTVSVGGAVFPHDGIDLDRLLEVADSALYLAKGAGRNAVCMGRRPIRPASRPVRADYDGRSAPPGRT